MTQEKAELQFNELAKEFFGLDGICVNDRFEYLEKTKKIFDVKWGCSKKRRCFKLYLYLLGIKLQPYQLKTVKNLYKFKESYKNRNCKQLVDWRIKVFNRDGYKCQGCEKIGGNLQAHHIIPYKEKESRYDLNNGQTLCIECHKKTDSYMKRI